MAYSRCFSPYQGYENHCFKDHKFKLIMVMCTSWDVFQTKLEELFIVIEVVEMFSINTFVHSRDGFTKKIKPSGSYI